MSIENKSEANGGSAIRPVKLSHAVLRTTRFEDMVNWYQTVLNAEILQRNDFLAFMTYDDEHHRIAIAAVPGTVERPKHCAGLDHLAFTFGTLGDLVATYERLKSVGIEPRVAVNHGLTTSLYYKDPDGNGIELQIDNIEKSQFKEWMRHGMSKENPFGTTFDPAELASKYHAGVPESEIKRYKPSSTMDTDALRRLSE